MRVHQLSGSQRPVQHQCSLQGRAPTGTEQLCDFRTAFAPGSNLDTRLLGPGSARQQPPDPFFIGEILQSFVFF